MAQQLVPAHSSHVEAIGTICYDAFRAVQERHGLLPDWASPAAAQKGLGLLVDDPWVFGVVALRDGRVAGSNFVSLHDGWGGIGPLTVDPTVQGQGIGRALMSTVINHARDRGVVCLRLQQDAVNMVSLALYTSLGFALRDTTVVMESRQFDAPTVGVRPCSTTDLAAIARLGTRNLRMGRPDGVAAALTQGFTTLVRTREGRLTGYFIAGRRGHGVAETAEDMLALIAEADRRLAPQAARFFCPLSEEALFRQMLAVGCHATKLMTLMTLGPYEEPQPVWLPSVLG